MNIKEYTNSYWKEYAFYTIQSRGIPHKKDALTPVQRLCLTSISNTFQKTKSAIGKVIENGYHHSDASLEKAMSRLARTFGVANPLLEGDGFFGTQISPNPAAARYTSVKLSNDTYSILNEMKLIRESDSDGVTLPLPLSLPVGLSIGIQGVAVGYASFILPRKLEDVSKFMEGKISEMFPYFLGFDGLIERVGKRDWKISGNYKTDNKKFIEIVSFPPVKKWSSFVEKLNEKISEISEEYKTDILVEDASRTTPKLTLFLKKENDSIIKELSLFLDKEMNVSVRESVLFVDGSSVVNYESLEDYVLDFRKIKAKNFELFYQTKNKDFYEEIEYLRVKKAFILYISESKRNDKEINSFIEENGAKFRNRLEAVKLIESSTENISIRIEKEIESITKKIKENEEFLRRNSKKMEAYNKYVVNTIQSFEDGDSYEDFIEEEEVVENVE